MRLALLGWVVVLGAACVHRHGFRESQTSTFPLTDGGAGSGGGNGDFAGDGPGGGAGDGAGDIAGDGSGDDTGDRGGGDGDSALADPCAATPPIVVGPVLPVYPVNGADWNDYVRLTNRGPTDSHYNQIDVACAGTEASYFHCVHGGEKRTFEVTGAASCTGLSAVDSAGAFEWFCLDGGTVTFYSRQLLPGRGLRDLIAPMPLDFRTLEVRVHSDGGSCPTHVTQSTRWWNNPVLSLPDNSGGTAATTLNVAGGVHVATQSLSTPGYNLDADGVALVTLPGVVLTESGTATLEQCEALTGNLINGGVGIVETICTGAQRFLWIEADLSGWARAVYMADTSFSRVHNSRWTNAEIYADALTRSHFTDWTVVSGRFQELTTASTDNTGRRLQFHDSSFLEIERNSERNRFQDLVLMGGAGLGFNDSGSNNNTATRVFNGGPNGVTQSENFQRNTFAFWSVVNSDWTFDQGCGHFITVHNVLSVNTDWLVYPCGVNNRYSDMVGLNVQTWLAWVDSNDNFFRGRWITDGNKCTVNGTGNELRDPDCYTDMSLTTAPEIHPTGATIFVGVQSGDAANAGGGVPNTDYTSISDWAGFSAPERGWVKTENVSFPDFLQLRSCRLAGDVCSVFDFRLRQTDTIARARFGTVIPGAACPSTVDGTDPANIRVDNNVSPRTFLAYAFEPIGYDQDFNLAANHDGLCSSGELCVFAPNFGAYQGHGDWRQVECVFTGGTGMAQVDNVRMFAYPSNGI